MYGMLCFGNNSRENDIMDNYCIVKPCCMICDHAEIADIDDLDNLVPCHCPENIKNGGSPCMEAGAVCKYFMLNSILMPECVGYV